MSHSTLHTYAPIPQYNFSHRTGAMLNCMVCILRIYIIKLQLTSNSTRFALLRLSHQRGSGSYPGFSIGKATTYMYVNFTVHTAYWEALCKGEAFSCSSPSSIPQTRTEATKFQLFFMCTKQYPLTDKITFS